MIRHALLAFFERHPTIGMLFFIGGGLLMTASAIGEGTEKARFMEGPKAVGTVVELRGKRKSMTAAWRDQSGNEYLGDVTLYSRQIGKLKLGDQIDLVLAPNDHGEAIIAARLETDRPVRFLGVAATPLVFGGLGLVLFGMFFPGLEARLQELNRYQLGRRASDS